MANTRRETTASYRGEDALDSAGSTPFSALGSNPHHSNPVDTICQEFDHLKLPIREPMLSCIGSAVNISLDSHSKTNGSTVSLIHGNLIGRKLFSVSIYPDRTIALWTPPTWQQLSSFALANADLLLKQGHALGTWFNDWKLEHVLDVVVLSSDRGAALDLGLRFGQLSIFDLEARREIPISRASQESTAKLVEVGND